MATDPRGPFQVSWNQRGLNRLKNLGAKAKSLGILPEWASTVRRIVDRLETDPRELGDPLYPLSELNLFVHRMIVDKVVVHYAVHETQPIVFVKSIIPRFGHPLEESA